MRSEGQGAREKEVECGVGGNGARQRGGGGHGTTWREGMAQCRGRGTAERGGRGNDSCCFDDRSAPSSDAVKVSIIGSTFSLPSLSLSHQLLIMLLLFLFPLLPLCCTVR